jgi:hypothetical protein
MEAVSRRKPSRGQGAEAGWNRGTHTSRHFDPSSSLPIGSCLLSTSYTHQYAPFCHPKGQLQSLFIHSSDTYIACTQSTRPAVSRASFAARWSSTKAPTLKERLAELIPQKLEEVCTHVFSASGMYLTASSRSRQFVLSMAKRASAPSSLTSFTGKSFSLLCCLLSLICS